MAIERALLTGPALCVLAFSLSACGDQGSIGELGNASFGYKCTSDSDPICDADPNFNEGFVRAMPQLIAVGATFGVTYDSVSSTAQEGSAFVQPVSNELLASAAASGGFMAIGPGYAGLLAMRGSTVVDVIHVHLVAINHAQIAAPSPVSLSPGGLIDLRADALDASNAVLAGSLTYHWTSDDVAVAEVVSSATTNEITLRANAAGQTTLRVTVHNVSAEVPVSVIAPSPGSP